MRALVGVTSIPRMASTAFAEVPHETLPENYLQLLDAAGASPCVLPVHLVPAVEVVSRLDGLVLTGGGDVDPSLYGAERSPDTTGIDERRDRLESDFVREAVERDLPILALCRGIQVLNVTLGGSLIQDIATEVHDHIDHWAPAQWDTAVHSIDIEPGSLLHTAVGATSTQVNSMHHQAIDEVASDLRVVARTSDGVIEAVEAPDHTFCVGLQWHPECMKDTSQIEGLVEEFVRQAGDTHE